MIPKGKLDALAQRIIPAVLEAGGAILAVREGAALKTRAKRDDSPVTAADVRAEAVLLAALRKIAPAIPVVAEERAARHGLPGGEASEFFLVDPLDGTKEFVKKGTDFTVNVALVQGARPVLGVVHAPARGTLWYGTAAGGAFRKEQGATKPVPIAVRRASAESLAIVASRSHRSPGLEAWLASFPKAKHVSIGSSLKFCLVAEGKADLYPRLGPTMEWDTAAGDAILRAAGGETRDAGGETLPYNKPGFKNGRFIALGDPAISYPDIS